MQLDAVDPAWQNTGLAPHSVLASFDIDLSTNSFVSKDTEELLLVPALAAVVLELIGVASVLRYSGSVSFVAGFVTTSIHLLMTVTALLRHVAVLFARAAAAAKPGCADPFARQAHSNVEALMDMVIPAPE